MTSGRPAGADARGVRAFVGTGPVRSGDLRLETQGIAPIPVENRYQGPRWRSFTVWFTPNMEASGIFSGTIPIALGLGFTRGLAALAIGVVLGSLPVAILTLLGPRTGMGQLPLARLAYGRSVLAPAAMQWLSSITWDALVGVFGGQALQSLLHLPFWLGVAVVLALEGAAGLLGYEAIHQVEAWAAPVAVAFVAVVAVAVVRRGGPLATATIGGGAAIGAFMLTVALGISLGIGWASYASDYSRYLPADTPRRPLFWCTLTGLVSSYLAVVTIGLLMGATVTDQTAGGIRRLVGGGALGGFVMIAMVVGAVCSNAMNDYSGSLAIQAGGLRIRRPLLAAVATALAFGLIMWMHAGDLIGKFTSLLLFTGYWVVVFAVVVGIDWSARRRTVTSDQLWSCLRPADLTRGWPALVASLAGFAAMVPFMNTSLVVGPAAAALGGADLAFFVGAVVTAAVYLPLRGWGRRAHGRRRGSGRNSPPRHPGEPLTSGQLKGRKDDR